MGEVIFGIPFLLTVSCTWALLPLHTRRVRVVALLALVASAVSFVVYWGSGGYSAGVAAALAPAVLLASMRLLLELFSNLEAREPHRASPDSTGGESTSS